MHDSPAAKVTSVSDGIYHLQVQGKDVIAFDVDAFIDSQAPRYTPGRGHEVLAETPAGFQPIPGWDGKVRIQVYVGR